MNILHEDNTINVLMTSEVMNPYVEEIANALPKSFLIKRSIKEFFLKTGDYAIIHIQWPEEITDWMVPTDTEMERVREALQYWSKRSKIVITRHNILPNTNNSTNYLALYELVYAYADAVIHLGNKSLMEYAQRYPEYYRNAWQRIIPHHVYIGYPNTIGRDAARQHFKIHKNKKVILCFGDIRNEEEATMIINAYKLLDIKDKFLLAPRFFKPPAFRDKPLKRLMVFVKQWYYRSFFNASLGSVFFVENSKVQYYFNAADVVLIPRSKQLNSGVVFLALAFERLIVGPEGGNIGEVLEYLDNPVFNPDDIQSVKEALERAIKQAHETKPISCLRYPNSYYSLEYVANLHGELYKELLYSKSILGQS